MSKSVRFSIAFLFLLRMQTSLSTKEPKNVEYNNGMPFARDWRLMIGNTLCPTTCEGCSGPCTFEIETGGCLCPCIDGYFSYGDGCRKECPVECPGCVNQCTNGPTGCTCQCKSDCDGCSGTCVYDPAVEACDCPCSSGYSPVLGGCQKECPVQCPGCIGQCSNGPTGCTCQCISNCDGCSGQCVYDPAVEACNCPCSSGYNQVHGGCQKVCPSACDGCVGSCNLVGSDCVCNCMDGYQPLNGGCALEDVEENECTPTCTGCLGPCHREDGSCVCPCDNGFFPTNGVCEPVTCQEEEIEYPPNNNVLVAFPTTQAGYTNPSTTKCPEGTSNAGKSYGTRSCTVGGEWMEPIWLSSCDTQIESYVNVTINSTEVREEVAQDLEVITSEPDQLEAENVTVIVEVLDEVLDTPTLNQNTSSSVITTVSNILQMDPDELRASNQTEELLMALDAVGEKVELNGSEPYEEVTSSVAMAVVKPAQQNATQGIGYEVKALTTDQTLGFRSDQLATFYGNPNKSDSSYIKVPYEAISDSNVSYRTSFYALVDGTLFNSQNLNGKSESNQEFTSQVVLSATVVGSNRTIANLVDPIQIKFSLQKREDNAYNDKNTYCGFWLSNSWWNNGSHVSAVEDKFITCTFNHLTNFAALFNGDYADAEKLNRITLTGCSISVVCLVVTLLFLIFFKPPGKKKMNNGSFLLGNLSASLLLLNVCMIVSEFVHDQACQAIAVLIHFFMVSSMAWMLVEGFTMFIATAFPLLTRSYFTDKKLFIGGSLVGWLLPAVFVACVVAVDHSIYSRDDNVCWMKDKFMLLAGIPLIVLICINLVFYVLIVYNVMCRKTVETSTKARQLQKRNAIISLSLFVTLGGTWIFALALIFTDGDDDVVDVFAYMFAVLNSLQGFFVFLMYMLREEPIRKATSKRLRSLSSAMSTYKSKVYSVQSSDRHISSTEDMYKNRTS